MMPLKMTITNKESAKRIRKIHEEELNSLFKMMQKMRQEILELFAIPPSIVKLGKASGHLAVKKEKK